MIEDVEYIRVTIAVHPDNVPDANQLARVLGYGPDDDRTFTVPGYQHDDGNAYCVASGLVKPAFVEDVFVEDLPEPEWGADMEAASRAQAKVVIGGPAQPDKIAAIVGDDPQAALVALGLTRSYPEE